MNPVCLGAVDYLNARPLVFGLERRPDLFSIRFDAPSLCATLLHGSAIDVGMIPTIEYNRGAEDYRIVPGMAIISDGPVASVALFTKVPLKSIRTIAADTSSRTSHGLLRVLCAERFGISPEVTQRPPDPDAMFASYDAALIIGDPALYLDPASKGVEKIDLGEQWTAMTGLPFVWAFWAGRPEVLSPQHLEALTEARDAGVANSDGIADDYCGSERAAMGRAYLRDNISYTLGEREIAGLGRYYELAERHGVIERRRQPAFY
jgi:chorismate dehydratase